MNKLELIDRLSAHDDVGSKVKAGRVLDYIIGEIVTEVASGNNVNIGGFGRFSKKITPARSYLAPGQSSATQVPEHGIMKFKPSEKAKRTVSGV